MRFTRHSDVIRAALAVCVLGFGQAALGDEIVVPDEMPFSVALALAVDGDVITLKPNGSPYQQNPGFAWDGKALTIRGSSGDPADVVIDGFNFVRGLTITGAGSAGSVIQDLTIRNGSADNTGGAGVYAAEFITIDNCLFENNTAVNPGGGLRCFAGATIRNTTFRQNDVTQVDHADGGAAYLNGGVMYTIESCRFEDNFAPNTGGAVRIDASPAQITGCVFEGNGVDSNVDDLGGAFFSRSGSIVTFDACLFVGNSSSMRGGAISSLDSGTLTTVRNSIFQDNHADIRGGAIAMETGSDVVVKNCTFESNTAPSFASVATNVAGSTAITRNCIFWNDPPAASQLGAVGGGSAPTARYSIVQGGYGGVGNLDVDPDFVNASADDLRLAAGSPAIDAGDSTIYDGPFADYDGLQRGTDDPATADTGNSVYGPVVDMGAFEFQPGGGGPDPCPADTNGDGVVNVTDLLNLLAAWGSCF